MRIIHTSDWHLGQHFIGKSRMNEHRAFLAWLLEQVETHRVDAILVAGDVFDTAAPPSYARQLYNEFIVDLQAHRCQLLILAGNHDSVATLEESTHLLACLNTTVIAAVASDLHQQVLVLDRFDSGSKQPGAVVCAIPFIRPRDVLQSQAGQSATQKQQSLQQAISDHYQQVFALAQQKSAEFDPPLPIIATGHLTTVGVKTSDSVRDIYIGTLEAFPASALPDADYIALGHIHRAQKVAKCAHIRYSGSPIPLSFDEVGTVKSVYLVDFSAGKLSGVEPLTVPTFQPLKLIKGDLAGIEAQLQCLKDYSGELPIWLDIEVDTETYLTDLHQRIEAMTVDLPVEILLLRRAKKTRQWRDETPFKETLNEFNPAEVFDKRLSEELFETQAQQQQLTRVKTVFAEIVDRCEQQLAQEQKL